MRHRATPVLVLCGLIGAVVGLCHPQMQDAVEMAQAHAGVIAHDAANPFFAFAIRVWSLQVQVPALLLHWGVSERAVSALISAAMGALSFQALGMTTLAAGGRRSIACLAPGIIAAFGLARGGIVYPVLLFGTTYTWGAIGLSICLLAVALVAAGSVRLGALLLGLLPAVHAALGLTTCLVVAIIAIVVPSLRKELWSARGWLFFGIAVTAASLGIHLWRLPMIAAADWTAAPSLADAVLRSWDVHRQLLPVKATLVAVAIAANAVAALILWRRLLTPQQALLPLFVLIMSAAGIALHLTRALPASAALRWIWVMMPGRLVNFSVLAAAALAIGVGSRAAALATARMKRVVTLSLAVVSVGYLAREIIAAPANWAAKMDVAANDAFYLRVSQGHAALLTSSDLSGLQIRTRRPIILNGAWIDALPYAPESAAAINRALIDIYGVDLLHPPADSLDGLGSLPGETGRALWESRSASEWLVIASQWHIDQIVTCDDWHLQLPRVSTGHGLALFVIPPQ